MISWAVVAHEARIVQATDLARTVGALITVDDGTAGADANHLKAWAITATLNSEWCGVLEDDALPVLGFNEQASAALASSPADVVSLYLGQGKPKSWQQRIARALDQADEAGAHWLVTHHVLHAVAVVMRTELCEDWLRSAPSLDFPIDQRMSEWARMRGHRIAYAIPSLVEHADWPTLVQHRDRKPRTEPRIAWRTGTRGTWNNRTISI